jgi:hypothetical protein
MKFLIPFSQAEINQAIDEGCRQFEYEITGIVHWSLEEFLFSEDFYDCFKLAEQIKTISEEMT